MTFQLRVLSFVPALALSRRCVVQVCLTYYFKSQPAGPGVVDRVRPDDWINICPFTKIGLQKILQRLV